MEQKLEQLKALLLDILNENEEYLLEVAGNKLDKYDLELDGLRVYTKDWYNSGCSYNETVIAEVK